MSAGRISIASERERAEGFQRALDNLRAGDVEQRTADRREAARYRAALDVIARKDRGPSGQLAKAALEKSS